MGVLGEGDQLGLQVLKVHLVTVILPEFLLEFFLFLLFLLERCLEVVLLGL